MTFGDSIPSFRILDDFRRFRPLGFQELFRRYAIPPFRHSPNGNVLQSLGHLNILWSNTNVNVRILPTPISSSP